MKKKLADTPSGRVCACCCGGEVIYLQATKLPKQKLIPF